MRASGSRAWFRVHSFTGVVTGLLLFVICWSGTFAVLSNEIDWLVTPQARVVPGGERVSWGELEAAVQGAHPAAEIVSLGAPRYRRSAAEVLVELPWQSSVRVFVDPYTAKVQGAHSYLDVQRFFRSFHYALFLPEVGIYVVSIFSLTMVISLAAALSFYRRWWRRFLRRPRGRGRALWSGLHSTGGLWSMWFLLLIGVTGAWYLFEAARLDFGDGKVSFAGDPRYSVHATPEPGPAPALAPMPLDALVRRARALRPDLDIRSIALLDREVVFEGQAGHLLVRDRANRLHLDARTGEVLYEQTPRDYPLYWRWSDTADPLHFGDFAGLWSKAVWAVFGLVLCALILTGTWLHANRLAREAGGRPRHRWPGTAAALLVSLLVLAASVPGGLHEAREYYGPIAGGVKRLPTLAPGVAAVIACWTALTLAIIGAWVVLLLRPRAVLDSPGVARARRNAVRVDSMQ